MSDREILLRWLGKAALRLGWSRRMPELGRLACALVGLRMVPEVLETLGAASSFVSALSPLLIGAALALVLLFAWRFARPITLAQAAGAADAGAGLKDELKSAHWFAERPARDAYIDLLLARAAHTARRLDPRRLFPLRVPRSAVAALVLGILTGSLAWFSPRIALPVMRETLPAATAASTKTAVVPAGETRLDKTDAARVAEAESSHQESPAWAQLDLTTEDLPTGAGQEAARRAAAARDARLAAQVLQALQSTRTAAAEQDPAVRPDEQTPADATPGLRASRLHEVANPDRRPLHDPTPIGAAEELARIRQQLREQMGVEEQRKLQGQPAQGEATLNNRLRAIARNSASQREVAYGEGEVAEAGSQTSVDGAATGERTGRSRAGGSEGEHPHTGPSGDSIPEPVLGDETVRLEAKLQKVRAEHDDPKKQDAEEAFYAATQRQASQLEHESVITQWRLQREAIVPPSRTPLAYREAVKRYFLTQHGKEE
jgi:hypothetical protein